MVQIAVCAVLLAALFGSGVFRWLWQSSSPKSQRKSDLTGTKVRQSRVTRETRPPMREARPTNPRLSRPSRVPPDDTRMGTQLKRLAERLSLLETALETGEATVAGSRHLRSPGELRRRVRTLWRQGADVATMVRQLHLSQGEVELIVRMITVEG